MGKGVPARAPGAERQDGGALAQLGQALAVAGQRPEMGKPPVAEQDGLGLLEVRVAGQQDAHVALRRA